MQSNIIELKNYKNELKNNSAITTTEVNQSIVAEAGDYGFGVFELEPHGLQRPHFHSYGDIDIFMVVEGQGYLHLAQLKDNQVLEHTKEKLPIKQGDVYSVRNYSISCGSSRTLQHQIPQ